MSGGAEMGPGGARWMSVRRLLLAALSVGLGLAILVVLWRAVRLAEESADIWPADHACDADQPCRPGECTRLLARVPGPGGKRSALLLLTEGGGATVGQEAEVCVEERGRLWPVAVGYEPGDLRAAWVSPTLLRVEGLASGAPTRSVDVTSGTIACEPVRPDWNFCTPDGRPGR
jgi:hypothetical protein